MRSGLKILAAIGLFLAPAAAFGDETAFGDWAKQCEPAPGGKERCYLIQTVQADERPVMVVIVAYSPKRDRVAAMIDVPLGMHIPTGLRISADGVEKRIEFEQCLPAGCRAMLQMDDALLSALKEGKAAQVVGRSRGGGDVEMPLSANGFEQAFGAL